MGMDQKIEWVLSGIKRCQNSRRKKAGKPCVLPSMNNSIDEPVNELGLIFFFTVQVFIF